MCLMSKLQTLWLSRLSCQKEPSKCDSSWLVTADSAVLVTILQSALMAWGQWIKTMTLHMEEILEHSFVSLCRALFKLHRLPCARGYNCSDKSWVTSSPTPWGHMGLCFYPQEYPCGQPLWNQSCLRWASLHIPGHFWTSRYCGTQEQPGGAAHPGHCGECGLWAVVLPLNSAAQSKQLRNKHLLDCWGVNPAVTWGTAQCLELLL